MEKYIPHLKKDVPEIFEEVNVIPYSLDVKCRTEHLGKGEDLASLPNGNFVVVKNGSLLEEECD